MIRTMLVGFALGGALALIVAGASLAWVAVAGVGATLVAVGLALED